MKILVLFVLFIPAVFGEAYRINKPNKPIRYQLVTVTTYTVNEYTNDTNRSITACGFKLSQTNPRKHRIIAISRDLKKIYKFGNKIRILNAGRFNGVYVVKDLMNKRWRKRIDILINPHDKPTKLYNIKIIKI